MIQNLKSGAWRDPPCHLCVACVAIVFAGVGAVAGVLLNLLPFARIDAYGAVAIGATAFAVVGAWFEGRDSLVPTTPLLNSDGGAARVFSDAGEAYLIP